MAALGSRLEIVRAIAAGLLIAGATTGCMAQRSSPLIMAAVPNDDAAVVTAFRALLDEVIGDSADRVCVSVATTGPDGSLMDADPSTSVLRALHGTAAKVLPRSVCAADEQNFGNPRGLLRLRDVSRVDDHTLIVHAEAIGDHSARYECRVARFVHAAPRAQCRITERDWPGSQTRD
jgi:hypothetical protein